MAGLVPAISIPKALAYQARSPRQARRWRNRMIQRFCFCHSGARGTREPGIQSLDLRAGRPWIPDRACGASGM